MSFVEVTPLQPPFPDGTIMVLEFGTASVGMVIGRWRCLC